MAKAQKLLVIVESPAKAKTIQKFLGPKATVKASMGHVRDLPKSKLGVDVDSGFQPQYVVIRGKSAVLKELKKEAEKAARVLLATDPDREGEAISWHLMVLLGMDPKDPCRVEFHEITRDVVLSSMKTPRGIDNRLVNAQQARRVLDRLVGYRLSPLLWKKVQRGLSAGRVQSVAVRLLCDREKEISAFRRQEYWTISGSFRKPPGEPFAARLATKGKDKVEIPDEAAAAKIIGELSGASYVVSDVSKKERRRRPQPPFTTSTLQQEASRRLGFTVKKTMAVAQRLYEGLDAGPEGTVGLITYMRTDSTRVSKDARAQAVSFIKERYGKAYVGPGALGGKKSQFVQGAHEAIRPTAVTRLPENLKKTVSADEYKLYKLIWDRFVASQMQNAVFEVTTVDIKAEAGGDAYSFRASGRSPVFDGYLAVYAEADGQDGEADSVLPPLARGDVLELVELEPEQHFTEPPPRYTEASLVKAMEENGIGRPSTYAPIIDLVQRRGYVEKEGRSLRPTELGMVVVDFLREHFPAIIDIEFTANMEDRLDQVERGASDWHEILSEFYGPFVSNLKEVEQTVGRVRLPAEPTDLKCDLCGKPMVVKLGRYGRFLACSGFPECKNARPMSKEAGVDCPKCGRPIVERRTKTKRKFFGCSGYPECTFTTWYEPLPGRTCPRCGWFLVKKRKKGEGEIESCVNPECGDRGEPISSQKG